MWHKDRKDAKGAKDEEKIKKVKQMRELHLHKGNTFYQQLGEQQIAAMNDETVKVNVMDFQ